MALLVLGGTGTLGRQIIRKALNEGFQVKCLVRNFRRAAFLKEWGAELIYGDLVLPETIPLALIGVSAIIDCSTGRPDDTFSLELIDLNSKYILIESAIKANIKRLVFFSISSASMYSDIKLVMLKIMLESRIKMSNLNFTIFCLPGFFQGLVSQYALPILDKKFVWMTKESSAIPYISTQDVANITVRSLSVCQFKDKYLSINGNKCWRSLEIINLCERISNRRANINQVPAYILSFLQKFAKIFQWTRNIADRLAFAEILSGGYKTSTDMKEILYILRLNKEDIESLELYLQEYFERIMKKVRELNYQVLTSDKNANDLDF
uniref:NmrA-like domain-containing protein n=1 Tax=Vertebrata lanosa TaxID=1261582 RepID=A0A0B5W3K3_9FLOR|nr:hypothetical protein [Vertebrata lanosa]AJH65980.1 hypothetical protein [Vertebrata lanosa]